MRPGGEAGMAALREAAAAVMVDDELDELDAAVLE